MYGGPLLAILTSPKKGNSSSASDQQQHRKNAGELLSVDELLDNPWHYDCVVSPRLSSSSAMEGTNQASRAHATSPRGGGGGGSGGGGGAGGGGGDAGKGASPHLCSELSSNYVSLSSFINPPDKASLDSSLKPFKPISPVLSKCRDRESKFHPRTDPSRIRSYAGCLAVD